MDLGLSGLQAIVIGGSAGIGSAVVKALAAEGCSVAFSGRNEARIADTVAAAREVAADSSTEVDGHRLDISDRHVLEAWFASFSRIDIVVTCVSALSADWNAAISSDIKGTINVIEVAEPFVSKSPFGAITYVGSKASSFATPGFEAYGAAKAAMAHYLKSVAVRLTPLGVRVNVVSPGDTYAVGGFWDHIKNNAPAVYDATIAANPMKRLATPEEVAAATVFLSSPASSFVSGANWYVDGGATAHIQF
ncbi:SDR family oxidoreductase [Neorhizobium sp. JUb45]|uniref:SDR family NAD(P)-dependent oxidoreductase n=1 Tax=unclassified Neorhizobium TaxID=2629175 RepID=UPI001050A67A|nr:SDR family oxidoreductase [Neorhizobium sp. JUb45]TCR03018.1 NAD(P)-dependent dehydrogenase (short-subunit alcohol dehydrogenase family) [Neorhizobium sp. JUb45]